MKFYYAPSNDAYIELDARTHQTLKLCIDIIAFRLDSADEEEMPICDLLEEDEPARLADEIIRSILTPEQYDCYENGIIY